MIEVARSFRHGSVACLSLLLVLAASACSGDDGSQEETSATTTTGGSTATSGPSETTGASDTTGGWVDDCEGIELAQDGVLDVDVPAAEYVVISGKVLLNGDALPDADGPRGSLRFDYTPTVGAPGSATYALGDSGPENYSVVVPAGATSVHYVPDEGLCGAHPEGPMPCTGGALVGTIQLVDSGVLDVDIPVIVASGVVKQDGAALPDADDDRGHLEFIGRSGGVGSTAAFGADGPASYAMALFPGSYDVAFAGNAGLCAEGAAPVPCNSGVVLSGLTLEASGVLDVDVPRVEVSGAVTVNGAPMGDGAEDRGMLRFDATGGDAAGGLTTPAFGATGPVSYAASLVAGSYAVALVANPAQCAGEAAPTPCVGGRILPSVALMSSGVLDVDIPRIDLSGKITLAGADLPDESGDRGAVAFALDGGDAASVALESAGALTYALSVLPGEYTIALAANAGLCDGVTAPSMPCGGGQLSALELTSSGVLDVDIPVVEVSGKITLEGAALPTQTVDRGSVVFAGAGEGSVAVPLGTDPFSNYAITMMPGTYAVSYAAAAMECVGLPDDAMPCGGGQLASGIALMSDGVFDVDIPAIDISGNITYDGGALPNLTMPRGVVQWTRAGAGAGPAIDLGTDGAKSYAVAIIPGRWVVGLTANAGLCDDAIPDFPCTDQMLLGCDTP
ncbi:MAG: hypothetical protein R3A79_27585 [Nannocystaceae bacterium]